MRVERFRVEDIDRFPNFGGQESLVARLPRDQVEALTVRGNHYSIFSGERIAACIGFIPAHDWRCGVWSLLQSGAPEMFAAIHIVVRRLIREQPWARIEAHVDPEAEASVRWVRLLGFECESPLKPYYLPDGRAASEWVFVKRMG